MCKGCDGDGGGGDAGIHSEGRFQGWAILGIPEASPGDVLWKPGAPGYKVKKVEGFILVLEGKYGERFETNVWEAMSEGYVVRRR